MRLWPFNRARGVIAASFAVGRAARRAATARACSCWRNSSNRRAWRRGVAWQAGGTGKFSLRCFVGGVIPRKDGFSVAVCGQDRGVNRFAPGPHLRDSRGRNRLCGVAARTAERKDEAMRYEAPLSVEDAVAALAGQPGAPGPGRTRSSRVSFVTNAGSLTGRWVPGRESAPRVLPGGPPITHASFSRCRSTEHA